MHHPVIIKAGQFLSRFSLSRRFEVPPHPTDKFAKATVTVRSRSKLSVIEGHCRKSYPMEKHKKRGSAATTACYTTAYAVNALMASDSSKSSTKMPLRPNGETPSCADHLFPQPDKKSFRVASRLLLTPPGPGTHIHWTHYPHLFLVLLYTQ